jgi:trehalose 6-phosphate synthase/phosphatase
MGGALSNLTAKEEEGLSSKRAQGNPTSGRLLIVSNRLPITVKLDEGGVDVVPSSGGLATGLKGPHEKSGGLWIGWPGQQLDGLPAPQKEELAKRFEALRVVPLSLSEEEIERYYEGYSNEILWPLFHYFPSRLPMEGGDFESYESVNRKFADAVAAQYQAGDTIWVQDYQLMLVPQMLREKLPDARIGFFLHIPFPSSEVFRTLPTRERILEGLLGADLIGFHTASYMRHFASSVLRLLGSETEVDQVRWGHRHVQLGVFPMGVDAKNFSAMAETEEVAEQVRELRRPEQVKLIVGIDRLDYTKGIPRRLLAFERLLLDHPELRERVRMIQVSVPSRTQVEAYQDYRAKVDLLIGRIHGEFATPTWVPVHYLYRGISKSEIVALYRAADVMVVTPIRDGMNLVAKEFVASRNDDGGVLVLSEFAGAANELGEALLVNPYNVERTAAALYEALTMSEEETHSRMRSLRQRVMAYDVQRWADAFLTRLGQLVLHHEAPSSLKPSSPVALSEAAQMIQGARHRVLMIDYDGTLVGFTGAPELARPDAEVLTLLKTLAEQRGTEVHVISGRQPAVLEAWLGQLPIGLHAEHGFWSRPRGAKEWLSASVPPATWRQPVLEILQDFATRTPGSRVEEKNASVAFHYRMADPEYGLFQANELKTHLAQLLSNAPVELLSGNKVLEIRPHGIHKGRVVKTILEEAPKDCVAMAIGDDRTDEDLFAALPPQGISVHVGPAASIARLRVPDVKAARAFLRSLIAT